jgi:hypothetical protein
MSKMFFPASFFKRHVAVFTACLILLIGAGQFGIARAASVSKDVFVCVNKKSGAMRQVTKAKCAKTERLLRLTSGAEATTGETINRETLICVNKKSGAMRQVTKAKCAKTERLLRLTSGTEAATSTTVVTGPTGAKGDTGAAGAKGDTGAKGETGAAGTKGDTGAKGETGAAGTKGDTGAKGDTGDKGATGAKGDTGDAGAAGPTGARGPTGATGPTGPGTLWNLGSVGNFSGLPTEPNMVLDDPVEIRCWKPSTTPTYSLSIGASATEIVIATVSRAQVAAFANPGTSSTYVLENSPVVEVGGDRTTDEVWDIRVFDTEVNSNNLKYHYIATVYLSSDSCRVIAWKTE